MLLALLLSACFSPSDVSLPFGEETKVTPISGSWRGPEAALTVKSQGKTLETTVSSTSTILVGEGSEARLRMFGIRPGMLKAGTNPRAWNSLEEPAACPGVSDESNLHYVDSSTVAEGLSFAMVENGESASPVKTTCLPFEKKAQKLSIPLRVKHDAAGPTDRVYDVEATIIYRDPDIIELPDGGGYLLLASRSILFDDDLPDFATRLGAGGAKGGEGPPPPGDGKGPGVQGGTQGGGGGATPSGGRTGGGASSGGGKAGKTKTRRWDESVLDSLSGSGSLGLVTSPMRLASGGGSTGGGGGKSASPPPPGDGKGPTPPTPGSGGGRQGKAGGGEAPSGAGTRPGGAGGGAASGPGGTGGSGGGAASGPGGTGGSGGGAAGGPGGASGAGGQGAKDPGKIGGGGDSGRPAIGPTTSISDIVAWWSPEPSFTSKEMQGPVLLVYSLDARPGLTHRAWLGVPGGALVGEGSDSTLLVYYATEAHEDGPYCDDTKSYDVGDFVGGVSVRSMRLSDLKAALANPAPEARWTGADVVPGQLMGAMEVWTPQGDSPDEDPLPVRRLLGNEVADAFTADPDPLVCEDGLQMLFTLLNNRRISDSEAGGHGPWHGVPIPKGRTLRDVTSGVEFKARPGSDLIVVPDLSYDWPDRILPDADHLEKQRGCG